MQDLQGGDGSAGQCVFQARVGSHVGRDDMQITVTRAGQSVTLSLPPTERCINVRGFMLPVDMIAVVRLDVADTTIGVPAVQCLSNPMERGE